LLINQASIKPFYLGDETRALGETLVVGGYDLQVSGVLENYNWYTLKSKFTPMVFWPQRICSQKFSIKINGDISNTVDRVEKVYKSYFEGNPFDYYFLDENFNRLYKDDQAFGKLVSLLSLLAMAISFLGLFALVSFTIIRKTKEIGVRKVLGASVKSIVTLLSWQFMKPVVLSCAISVPVAWYLINEWLSTYAFRISFPYEIFLLSFLVLALLAMATISFQTIGAASNNPVDSLRSE
jgi:putative ABC transport system permease protein